jgi:hypothetical protein
MSTALLATGRITQPYTIGGVTHKARAYVRGLTLGGGIWRVNSRTLDENDIVWSDAANQFANNIGNLCDASTVFGAALLEQIVDGVWVTQDVFTVTVTTKTGTYKPATQVTMVLRDINFKKVKVVVMEGTEAAPQHINGPTDGGTQMDLFTHEFGSTHTNANASYVWMVGRGNQYLATSPFVGLTVTLNRKIRRRRGLT